MGVGSGIGSTPVAQHILNAVVDFRKTRLDSSPRQ